MLCFVCFRKMYTISMLSTCPHQCWRLVHQRPSMCNHASVIMHVKDPLLSVIRVGHCVPSAGLFLSLYSLHVLNRDVNLIQTNKQNHLGKNISGKKVIKAVTVTTHELATYFHHYSPDFAWCSFVFSHSQWDNVSRPCQPLHSPYMHVTLFLCGIDKTCYYCLVPFLHSSHVTVIDKLIIHPYTNWWLCTICWDIFTHVEHHYTVHKIWHDKFFIYLLAWGPFT